MNGNYHSKEKYYCISYSQEGFALKKLKHKKKKEYSFNSPVVIWKFVNFELKSLLYGK